MRDTFESLCDKVYARTSYGMREEFAEHRGYKLVWSNNRAEWMVPHRGFRKGDVLRLDANHIAAYADKKDLDEWAPNLPGLPLYSNAFEARKQRGLGVGYVDTINRNQLMEFGFTEEAAKDLVRMINNPDVSVDTVLEHANSIMRRWKQWFKALNHENQALVSKQSTTSVIGLIVIGLTPFFCTSTPATHTTEHSVTM